MPLPVITIGNATSGSKTGMYLLQLYISRQVFNDTSTVVAQGEGRQGEQVVKSFFLLLFAVCRTLFSFESNSLLALSMF